LTSLLNSNKRWSVAEGKIYDLNKPPVLAVRGSETEIRLDGNILDDPFGLDWIIADFNRRGVGINQFENNRSSVLDWLNRASNPEQEASSTGDALFKYKPSITGHSLGGGLSQRFAYAYNGELGEVVTFNAPGIDKESVNSDVQVGRVKHYVTIGDIVTMAGDTYLPGEYAEFSYRDQPIIGIAGKHTNPILTPKIERTNQTKPTEQSKLQQFSSTISAEDSLGRREFTYLPDAEYLTFQILVATLLVNPVNVPLLDTLIGQLREVAVAIFEPIPLDAVAPSLIFRYSTELGRVIAGERLPSVVGTIQEKIQTLVSSIRLAIDLKKLTIEPVAESLRIAVALILNKPEALPVYLQAARDKLKSISVREKTSIKVISDISLNDSSANQILAQALIDSKNYLKAYASRSDFLEKMEIIFGSRARLSMTNSIQQAWQQGDFSDFPEIRIVSKIENDNLAATYSLGDRVVYISNEFIAENVQEVSKITAALLEELGHFVDEKINQEEDSPGDEGELFSAFVTNASLMASDIQKIQQENDLGFVESGVIGRFNVIDNLWEAIPFYSLEAWQQMAKYPGIAWVVMLDWREPAWTATTKWTDAQWQQTTTWTEDFWKSTPQFTPEIWSTVFEETPPGGGEPGTGEPGTGEPGTGEPGTGEPGTGEPGTGEPGTGEPGTGGEGNNPGKTLIGTSNDDVLVGTSGKDIIKGLNSQDILQGLSGDDELDGGDGDDRIEAGDGNDRAIGGSGQDYLLGGQGNDNLIGDDGDDRIFGGEGNDTLVGGQGQDWLVGEAGNDFLDGETGDNTLTGGLGDDIFVISKLGKAFIADFEDGRDRLKLKEGQSFESLLISGQNGSTQIATSDNQVMAILQNIAPNLISAADFV
jgi:hypothetical protein